MPRTDGLDDVRLDSLFDAVLSRAREHRCHEADVRIESLRTQYLSLRDALVETSVDDLSRGLSVRVEVGGSYGFASSVELTREAGVLLVDRAVDAARRTANMRKGPLRRAVEASHGVTSWQGEYDIDPTTVPETDKVGLLAEWSARLLSSDSVDRVTASLYCCSDDKHYANLNGTVTSQHRVRIFPALEILGVDDRSGSFETMRTLAPPVGRGFEYLAGKGWDFDRELEELPELLKEKRLSTSVKEGTYDLVIDPTNLWLTIHESIGHATELDRALGFEAGYAGTSFATPDKLSSFRYGSPLMNVTGDRTEPFGLATIGYDDEGVECQRFDIVTDGIFVGYQLDREFASYLGVARSNGCAFADSPLTAPMQRMANVTLSPKENGPSTKELIEGVEDGIYVVGDKSWSIDMQRYNFQFTGQRFYSIRSGRLAGQVKDVAYQASTPSFWGSLEGLGGPSTYLLCGAMNCGKGQPAQTAPVSHGAPSALFRAVRVINTGGEMIT